LKKARNSGKLLPYKDGCPSENALPRCGSVLSCFPFPPEEQSWLPAGILRKSNQMNKRLLVTLVLLFSLAPNLRRQRPSPH